MSTTPSVPGSDEHTEVPGDLNAPDIVSPTGEEMPRQTHDEPDAPADGPSALPARELQNDKRSLTRRPVEGHIRKLG